MSEYAHGFLGGHSVRTNAEPHVGKDVILRLDITDFFGTIHFGRVRGLLIALGYGYPVATVLAALMTEAVRQPVVVGETRFFPPVGPRTCPQGAPTSPGLSNAVVVKMDRRLAGLARRYGFAYTRYADDLTFSGNDIAGAHALRLLAARVVEEEGFAVNQRKTQIRRNGSRQMVTGVVVNDVLGLSRQDRRRLRAAIHHYRQSTRRRQRRTPRNSRAWTVRSPTCPCSTPRRHAGSRHAEHRRLPMTPRLLRHPVFLLAVGLAVLPAAVIAAGYTWGMAAEVAIFVLVGLGFNLLLGYTGLLSFGHGLFFGLAAYCTALTQIHWFPDSMVLPFVCSVVVLRSAGAGTRIPRAAAARRLLLAAHTRVYRPDLLHRVPLDQLHRRRERIVRAQAQALAGAGPRRRARLLLPRRSAS